MKIIPLLKKLGKIKVAPSQHQKELKKVLLQSKYFKKIDTASSLGILSQKVNNISLSKKAFALILVVVLVVTTVFTQVHFSAVQTVDAKVMVDQAISKMNNPESAEEKLKLELLQKAKDSNHLKYLGEETTMDGKKMKKISFNNPDIGNEIIILLGVSDNTVDYRFALDDNKLPMEWTTLKLQDQKIIDHEILAKKLKNPQLAGNPQRDFLLRLIDQQNQKFIEKEISQWSTSPEKNILEELKSLLPQSEVLITSIAYPGVWMISEDEFQLQTYALGNYKVNNNAALVILEQAIQKMSQLNSLEAKAKLKLLQKAKEANVLTYPGDREIFDKITYDAKGNKIHVNKKVKTLAFTQGNNGNITTTILIDPNDDSEKAVNFEFTFPGGTEFPGTFKINVDIKDNRIVDFKNVVEKLKNNGRQSNELRTILGYENNKTVELLDRLNTKEFSNSSQAVGQILKPLLANSDLLILWAQGPFPSKDKQDTISLTLWAYDINSYLFSSSDQNDQVYAKELLQDAIDKLTSVNSPEAKAKIQLLKRAQATSLEYLGEERSPYGNAIKKVSFNDEKIIGEIAINLDENSPLNSVNFPFVKEGDSVFWSGRKIEGADPETFEIFPGQSPADLQYARDKNAVYYNVKYGDNKIKGADAATFEIISNPYAKDKDNVYMYELKLTGADPETFEIFPGQDTMYTLYARDKKGIYCVNQKLQNSDVATFQVLGHGYAKDKNTVYYSCSEIEGADPETFVMTASNGFTQDKNNVYVDEKKIEGADPTTFKILNVVPVIGPYQSYLGYIVYAKDKNAVYYYSFHDFKKIEGADPATFSFMGGQQYRESSDGRSLADSIQEYIVGPDQVYFYEYAKDKNAVYHNGIKINEADPLTFQILSSEYGKDKNAVFYTFGGNAQGGFKLKNADPETFELMKSVNIFGTAYAKDKDNIFYRAFTLKDADLTSFQILGGPGDYAKDKNFVYHHGTQFRDVDPVSFEILDKDALATEQKNPLYYAANRQNFEVVRGFYVKDIKAVYFNEEKIPNADPATFEILGGYYGKDKNAVYYEGKNIMGADGATFKVSPFDIDYATDKNYAYHEGKQQLK